MTDISKPGYPTCDIQPTSFLESNITYFVTKKLINNANNLLRKKHPREIIVIIHRLSRFKISTIHFTVHNLPISISKGVEQGFHSIFTSRAPTDSNRVKNGSFINCPRSSSNEQWSARDINQSEKPLLNHLTLSSIFKLLRDIRRYHALTMQLWRRRRISLKGPKGRLLSTLIVVVVVVDVESKVCDLCKLVNYGCRGILRVTLRSEMAEILSRFMV